MAILPKRRKPQALGIRQSPQVRCAGHLTWVRGHECAIAGRAGHVCTGKIEAAHVRLGTDGGMAVKPGDNWAIPLCAGAHAEQHNIGEASFSARYGIDMKATAAALWRRSQHRKKVEK